MHPVEFQITPPPFILFDVKDKVFCRDGPQDDVHFRGFRYHHVGTTLYREGRGKNNVGHYFSKVLVLENTWAFYDDLNKSMTYTHPDYNKSCVNMLVFVLS